MFFEQWKNKWLYWVSPPISSTVYLYLYITEWRKNAKKYFDPLRSKSEKKLCSTKLKKKAQFLPCDQKPEILRK